MDVLPWRSMAELAYLGQRERKMSQKYGEEKKKKIWVSSAYTHTLYGFPNVYLLVSSHFKVI